MKKSFTLLECLVVVAIIVILISIAIVSYRKLVWSAKVVDHSIHNRGLLNKSVSEGKFKNQKQFDQELDRLKRQTEIGLKQGP
jgi:prepilin-type N-terminal cleavage/methylation domain-containing protein